MSIRKMPNQEGDPLTEFLDENYPKPNRRAGQLSTHCKRGHPLEPGNPNVYVNKKTGKRTCKACARAAHRRFRVNNPEVVRAYGSKVKYTPKTAFERAEELRQMGLMRKDKGNV